MIPSHKMGNLYIDTINLILQYLISHGYMPRKIPIFASIMPFFGVFSV